MVPDRIRFKNPKYSQWLYGNWIRLSNGNLFIHSPCAIDEHTKIAIEKLGEVEFIVAPGSYHYLYVGSAQSAFPNEEEQAFTIRTKINELVQLNVWGPYSSSRDQLVEMLDEAISGSTASDKN